METLCATLRDRRLLAWTAVLGLAAGLTFGVATAIIPNPVFDRSIPPPPFAIAVWLASAPLMGLVAATYLVPPRPVDGGPQPLGLEAQAPRADGTTTGTLGSLAVFLAIGCPVCNKVALLLLGASGAVSIWAPLQPVVGAASLGLLAGTAAWRLRLLRRGGACAVR
ncbi:MAG TPA: hypothetical protein VF763_03540 [Candidatus Limnocylindrales bacterium]